jgi:hypothetical protein
MEMRGKGQTYNLIPQNGTFPRIISVKFGCVSNVVIEIIVNH